MKYPKNIKLIALVFLLIGNYTLYGQLKIGGTPGSANSNALLEIDASGTPKKGLLLPRVALVAVNNPSPFTRFIEGLSVYNTATSGSVPDDVSPGFYVCDGTRWVRAADRYHRGPSSQPWYKANTVVQAANNTDSVYIQGNVGIGINNPLFRLHTITTDSAIAHFGQDTSIANSGNVVQEGARIEVLGIRPVDSNKLAASLDLSGYIPETQNHFTMARIGGSYRNNTSAVNFLTRDPSGNLIETLRFEGDGRMIIPRNYLDMNGFNIIRVHNPDPNLNNGNGSDPTKPEYYKYQAVNVQTLQDSIAAYATNFTNTMTAYLNTKLGVQGIGYYESGFNLVTCSPSSASFETFLDTTGSGFVKYIQMSLDDVNGIYPSELALTLDGNSGNKIVLNYTDFVPISASGTVKTYKIPINVRFITSLKVEARNANGGTLGETSVEYSLQ
ncbi:MAG TPA: hypothetical protein VFN30_10015 [Chitinophagaceae bacterium]|nr:hypothetical protein [Chitinophagaceae bacterium]